MKSDTRKIIRNPGRRKRERWAACLHEAAHCVAFATCCHVPARAHIFKNGEGLCFHGAVRSAFWEAVGVAVGEISERAPWAASVPRMRPRRSARRPRDFDEVQPDKVYLHRLRRETELAGALGLTAGAPLDLAEVTGQAQLFVNLHSVEIWNLAYQLFRDGAAGVPAR